jgi:N-acetylglucosamine-6-phosphate deacetylase
MSRVLLRDAEILDPEGDDACRGDLLIEGGRIRARLTRDDARPDDARVIDLRGLRLCPGFIDLHCHGSAIFCDASGLDEALAADSASYARHGTTAFLVTTVAWPLPRLGEFVTQLASSVSNGAWPGSEPIALHLEGPWINPGAAGAQPHAGIRPFGGPHDAELLDRGEGAIRMVTYAPELEGAPALHAELMRRGIVGALGHSLASVEVAAEAVERGARHVTHLFNAMGAVQHRTPGPSAGSARRDVHLRDFATEPGQTGGLAAAALGDDRLSCDLICDGVHVHPQVVALAARAKGDRLTLISDRVEPPATAAGDRSFGAGRVIDDGAAWRLEDGRLAGSRITLDAALRNLIDFAGTPLLDAVAACSLRPAQVLGIEAERGSLRPGARADFAVLDDALRVRETWIAGRRVYRA